MNASRRRIVAATKKKGGLVKVLVAGFVAMMVEDVFSTLMTVWEAHYRAVPAGLADVFAWIASLVCSALAIESIITDGWRNKRSMAIIISISVANFAGTLLGVYTAKWF